MGINYPGGIDSFNVPTDPEDTPLSEAGTSTRNHVELHQDTAAAVVALEQNTAQLNHDHSGSIGVSLSVEQTVSGLAAVNDLQNIIFTGTPTAGTYTLTINDDITDPLAYNAAASDIQTALEGLASIGTGNVSVSGSGPFAVTFTGDLADAAQSTLSAQSSLTGASVSINHVTVGAPGFNAVQVITPSTTPTSGTFTLSFGGQTTTALQYNAAPQDVQSALTALSSIGSNNVSVTGAGQYTVTFQGALAYSPQPLISASGSLFSGLFATTKLQQVNTHQNADTDDAVTSIHHTIGTEATQAAPGNHTHDYNGPTIYNQPVRICTSTTRPIDPPVGMKIWETDTNAERVWAAFPGNTLSSGINFTDIFNRSSAVVSWDATGSGGHANATSATGTHFVGTSGTILIVVAGVYHPLVTNKTGWAVSCDLGTTPMTLLDQQDNSLNLTGFQSVFYLLNPPTGEGTITMTATNVNDNTRIPFIHIESVSYNNVAAIGYENTNNSPGFGGGIAISIPSSPGDMIVGAWSSGITDNLRTPSQTQRVYHWPGADYLSLMITDTSPTSTTAVSMKVNNNALTCSAIAFNLIANASTLGSGYTQTYIGAANQGLMATPVSGAASWIVGENIPGRCIAVPTTSGMTTTVSNGQDFIFTTGTPNPGAYRSQTSSVDIYARRSADGNTYIRLVVGSDGVLLYYTTTGPTGEVRLASALTSTKITNIPWEFKLTDITFVVYRGGVQVLSFVDSGNVTEIGAAYRGWAWGMTAVPGTTFQLSPQTLTSLQVKDLPIYITEQIWQLLATGSKPILRAETHIGQEIAVNGRIAAFFDTVGEDLWGCFGVRRAIETTIPQNTDIVIPESGHYDINASVPWDPNYYGFDTASLGFTVNGQDIGRKTYQFMRGNGYAPSIAQTLNLSTSWYFAAGDVLRMVVSHNSNLTAWLYYDGVDPNKQMVFLDLTFTGP